MYASQDRICHQETPKLSVSSNRLRINLKISTSCQRATSPTSLYWRFTAKVLIRKVTLVAYDSELSLMDSSACTMSVGDAASRTRKSFFICTDLIYISIRFPVRSKKPNSYYFIATQTSLRQLRTRFTKEVYIFTLNRVMRLRLTISGRKLISA